jgi:hypothetical protein
LCSGNKKVDCDLIAPFSGLFTAQQKGLLLYSKT